MSDLVSVIVPVYNAERYLNECISSLAGQTFTELEILLVDDGSRDRSGDICDEWAERDSRIRVIHQKNQGVSAARNAGLDVATGRFVGFVDADDWIAPDMYESLVDLMYRSDADVGVCSFYVATPRALHRDSRSVSELYLDREGAFKYMCLPHFLGVMVWNKLFRLTVIQGLRFESMPESQSEDFRFMVDLLKGASKIAFDPLPKYFYRQTSQSLMHGGVVSMSGVGVADHLVKYVSQHHPTIKAYCEYLHASYLHDAYWEICRGGRSRTYASFLRQSRMFIRKVWIESRTTLFHDEIYESQGKSLSWFLISNYPRIYANFYVPAWKLARFLVKEQLY